jgi:hypothetical protein
MAQPKHDELESDEVADAASTEYDRLRELLNEHVFAFAEEHELPPGMFSALLIDVCVSSRMIDYVLSVSKPSGSGLKLELDRLRHEIEDHIRGCKRGADDFIRESGGLIRETAAELEGELEADAEDTTNKS